jgi:hypothetical protein
MNWRNIIRSACDTGVVTKLPRNSSISLRFFLKISKRKEWRVLYTNTLCVFMASRPVLLRMTAVSNRSCTEINTHTFCVQEISCDKSFGLWDNLDNLDNHCTIGQATDDNIIRRMSIAWWIRKGTDMYTEHVILFDFSKATIVRRRSLSVTFYVHCLSYWGKIRNFSWWLVSRSLPICTTKWHSIKEEQEYSDFREGYYVYHKLGKEFWLYSRYFTPLHLPS